MNALAMAYLVGELIHMLCQTREAKAQAPGVKLDALRMNSCHGLFGGRAGANHKSCLNKEAKAQAQRLILMDMHRKR